MLMAQYRDGKGQWINIPSIGIPAQPEVLAYEYCKQHGLLTRVADVDGKEVKTVKEFKCQKRTR